MTDSVGLADVREAAALLGGRVHRTALVGSRTLGERAGATVFLKLENLQKTGSFKPRGALNHMQRALAGQPLAGFVTVSAGNHAAAVAYAARCLDLPATVVMMEGASEAKLEATRSYGARVEIVPDAVRGFERARELERERGLYFVHPFDHRWTVAGAGTVGLEIFEDLPRLDAVLVGVGGGGLIGGVALALKQLRPGVRVLGVEPEASDAMSRGLEAGRVVQVPRSGTVADGLAAPFAGELNLQLARRYVDEMIRVSDAEILAAARLLLERTKLLVEPAGAACVAALLSGRVPGLAGGVVACVLSGGNVSREALQRILAA